MPPVRPATLSVRAQVGLLAPPDLQRPVAARLADLDLAVGDHPPAVLLVLHDGPVPRRLLDDPARDGTPHLLVSAEPGAVTIGPFVEPGRTACLRCIDAHLCVAHPQWSLLLEDTDLLVARDPALHPLALAWAAADLAAWADGRVPSTWSATVRIDADLDVRRTVWRRHPSCGCAWDALET